MASTEEIRTKLAEIVNDVAGVPVEDITPDKNFVDDLDIDSLSMVEIVYALQEAYNVDIPDEDVKDLRTVGDAVAYVEKVQKQA
ncbi:MAG: acyl carrier protein [Propionibacterium sp.]